MEKYIDLHMHSKYSDDGEFTPTQLVEQCHKADDTEYRPADTFLSRNDKCRTEEERYRR